MNLNDEYAAFCFDEACAVIISRMNLGERCFFREDKAAGVSKQDSLISFLKDFEKNS